jgi:NADPH2 dehydrogenase
VTRSNIIYHRIGFLKTAQDFQDYLDKGGIHLAFDPVLERGSSLLGQPLRLPNGFEIGNRFCVLPMEGWDGTPDGRPSELTFRRWRRFGLSGAKLIWGGEAAAVRPDGRANPNQLVMSEANLGSLAALRQALVEAHAEAGSTGGLYIGLQLTHSGRFSKPVDPKRLQPVILYHHPLLDRKFGLPPDYPVMSDGEIRRLIEDFFHAACLAQKAGFDFVDVKHCHGYLGHEFLSAVDRPGDYGGSFENRTRFLREITQGIRTYAPGLEIGVRLSAIDFIPYRPGLDRVGQPETFDGLAYHYAFGGDGTGAGYDLAEPGRFMDLLDELKIPLVCITAGSPYYNPHIQRPAIFPPTDGYLPPEDPLAGVARQITVTAELKKSHPGLVFVGSGYSYLQEWLAHVAQSNVRSGRVDCVGLGRMILPYPEFCRDVLAGRPLQVKRLCRTFSDCTTAPRGGLVSGCYPLDEFYKSRPEAKELAALKTRPV